MDTTTVNQMHHEYMFPCVSNYYSTPLAIKKGEGSMFMTGRATSIWISSVAF